MYSCLYARLLWPPWSHFIFWVSLPSQRTTGGRASPMRKPFWGPGTPPPSDSSGRDLFTDKVSSNLGVSGRQKWPIIT